jgi:hypothetical protein
MGKRSRKRAAPGERRPAAAGGASTTAPTTTAAKPKRAPRTRTGQRLEARPKPIWHPWPISEIALLVGVLFAVYGFTQGSDDGAAYIGGGVLMATLGVIELCAREHYSGFKSHTLLLSFLPVVALHTVIALWISDGYKGPAALLLDFGVFGALCLINLDRFRKARPKGATRR